MKKGCVKTILSMMAAATLMIGTALSAFAATADVTEDSIRIRSEASTSGNQVATGKKGDSYKILETVSGSDGNTWYKLQLNDGSSGYVRGDLVKVVQESSDAGNGEANEATSLAPTEGTAITETTATIAGNSSVNIRSGAGTSYAKVGSLAAGTSITLVAEANDSSGKKWYQFKCESQGMEGYIRSDLITISEQPQPVEGENAEGEGAEGEISGEGLDADAVVEEVAPPVENNDYEIVYTTDDAGTYAYYLYDHINNNRQKVNDLLGAVDTYGKKYNEAQDKIETFKIIAIVCGGAALICLVLAVVFLIKYLGASNDGMYDYDDDDYDSEYDDEEEYEEEYEDDEDDYEYEEPVRRRGTPSKAPAKATSSRSGSTTRATVSQRTSSLARPSQAAQVSRGGTSSSRPGTRPSSRPVPGESRRTVKGPSNFFSADDDDEFEFEFLNMDDKD